MSPLNLTVASDTDYIPIIKYNASTGQVLVPQDEGPDVPIQNWEVAIDLENLQELWLCFSQAGPKSAPLYIDGERTRQPENIADAPWKDGFEVLTFTSNEINEEPIGFRRWRGNANAHKEAIMTAYQTFEKEKGDNLGWDKIPVFSCHPRSQSTKHGGIWIPDLKLEKWVDRVMIDEFNNGELISSWKASFLRDWNGSSSIATSIDTQNDKKVPF